MDDTLRRAGRSRAVDDIAQVVWLNLDIRQRIRLRTVPGHKFKPCSTWSTVTNSQRRSRHAHERINSSAVPARCKDRARTSVLDHPSHGLISDRGIQRHRHATSTQNAKKREGTLEAVVHQDGDPRPTLHP